ncbi:MAG: energy-coupling factor ABC transporter substrate-binding protein [bacterium]
MKTTLIILAIVFLVSLPLVLHRPKAGTESFGGADDKARAEVERMHPDYKPWVQPLWNPPSGEIATLLFSLQAAIGAGAIGYYLGYLKGRGKKD